MTEERLAQLFADGTAPEHDAAFDRRVDAQIERERRGLRLLAFAVRSLVIVALAAALFVTVRTLEPALAQIAESSPQFMGVPLPLVLGALAVGLAVRTWLFVRLRLG
jgi:hypothetical protein